MTEDIKTHLNLFSGGKYTNLMTRYFFRGKFCNMISPKIESYQTHLLHQDAFMTIMTHAQFHFNCLVVILIWNHKPKRER